MPKIFFPSHTSLSVIKYNLKKISSKNHFLMIYEMKKKEIKILLNAKMISQVQKYMGGIHGEEKDKSIKKMRCQ